MPRTKNPVDEQLAFFVANLFLRGEKTSTIVSLANEKLKPVPPLNREGVYPLLAEARRLQMIRLVPPIEEKLAGEIAARFHCNAKQITVVRVPEKRMNEYVAAKAAELVLELAKDLGAELARPVGLGLGPGRATLDFSQHFNIILQAETRAPELSLFAICAGCPADKPEYSSTSFFNLFPREPMIQNRIGMFAESVVPARDFDKITRRPGVHEAFDAKKEGKIDIVVTSMGDFHDPHDLLGLFLKDAGYPTETLRQQGWIGSVQYRPFSATGPIRESGRQMRAVTLFELDDFVAMAETKGKHVVLIARQCGLCERQTRADALRPLLEVPGLRVWSEIVMDEATARDLLKDNGAAPRRGT